PSSRMAPAKSSSSSRARARSYAARMTLRPAVRSSSSWAATGFARKRAVATTPAASPKPRPAQRSATRRTRAARAGRAPCLIAGTSTEPHNTAPFPAGEVDAPHGVHRDRRRIARARQRVTLQPDGRDLLPDRIADGHPAGLPVQDEEIAQRVGRQSHGLIEAQRREAGARRLASLVHLDHLLRPAVEDEHGAVLAHRDVDESSFLPSCRAERAGQATAAVEDQEGVLRTVEEVDAAERVQGDRPEVARRAPVDPLELGAAPVPGVDGDLLLA